MDTSSPPRMISPSKITAWLDCPHYLTLQSQVDAGGLPKPRPKFSSFAELVAAKGMAHEQACLADYYGQGSRVLEVPAQNVAARESFEAWVARVGNPFADGYDVVYQMPFIHDGVRGIADFVERVEDADTGEVHWEPVDAKLTRVEAKPGHVLQLCFYAGAIEDLTGKRPRHVHLELGSGERESLQLNQFAPYWRRLRRRLAEALDAGSSADTAPIPNSHCQFCEFFELCEQRWRSEDSLHYIAGIRQPDIAKLTAANVATLGGLAEIRDELDGLQAVRLARLIKQAALQVEQRDSPGAPIPYSVIEPVDDGVWGRGLERLLPKPDDGDVFLDFEGHPFWRADTGLFFLFGLIENDDDAWRYREWWAHDQASEAAATAALIDHLTARRKDHPGMHVYHYNHTERSSLAALTRAYGVREPELVELVGKGAFVDLYEVVRNTIQVGAESYGLKSLERLTEFERSHGIERGAGAVIEYDRYMVDFEPERLRSIARYNEDDVRATRALRDWLLEYRDAELPWRDTEIEAEPNKPQVTELEAALHQFGPGTPERLLGDLVGYWWREWLAYIVPLTEKLKSDPDKLWDDPEVIVGLQPVGRIEPTETQTIPGMRFSFPEVQTLDRIPDGKFALYYLGPEGKRRAVAARWIDREAGVLDLVWGSKAQDEGYFPTVVVMNSWVDGKPKYEAVSEYGRRVVSEGLPDTATSALLQRALPRFTPGGGPAGGVFTDDLDDMCRWVTQLDRSYVAVQGPPGTGKTYSGAHLVYALIKAGKRVGITAMSHQAIDNLLVKVLQVFGDKDEGDVLKAVRHRGSRNLSGVKNTHNKSESVKSEYNLVAGTGWLFAASEMIDNPVDVLLIDEAGQLSLADTVAASCGARNLVLLGDPLQLPQVSQASHPNGSGRSALDHILGDAATVPDDRGVFLHKTWRMHPDVCEFISDQIYESRLISHPNCGRQTTVVGTGLRWLRTEHDGRRTSSEEEAILIAAKVSELMGTDWTNFDGDVKPLGPDDFMVVAPYNDQVRTIQALLRKDPRTADVQVGTVDKFQGGEGAVVFYSMTTSSDACIVRGIDFLFSRNRLNVAISRARCLAYLLCTDALLNSRARDVEDMRLLSTLNAFAEYAQDHRP